MDALMTGFDALRKVARLWKTIRRQRAVNRETYLRMMTIYCILSNTEHLAGDSKRSKIIQKFKKAATNFEDYLAKYHSMSRVVRLFKFKDMEEERFRIVAEIDELSEALNVVAAVTVMNIEASAIENAANVLTKLDSMHNDIRSTRARIQAEFAKKRRGDVNVARVASQKATSEQVDGDSKTPEQSRFMLSDVDDGSILFSTTSMSMSSDEISPSMQDRTTEPNLVEPISTAPLVDEPVLQYNTAVDVKELDERSEPEVELEPEFTVSGNVTENVYDAEKYDVEDLPEEEDEFDEHTDPQQQTILADNLSIPHLIALLDSVQTIPHIKEQALLLLIVKCLATNSRAEVDNSDGIPVLVSLVRTSVSFYTQLYALHCLSWLMSDDNPKMLKDEYVALRNIIREVSCTEVVSLVDELQHGDDKRKEVALVQCLCLSTCGNATTLHSVGIVNPLVGLLREGTTNHKLCAVETLRTLVDNNHENCSTLVQAGIIPPLVSQLRSGVNMQRNLATYMLGRLAVHNEEIRGEIGLASLRDDLNEWSVYALAEISLNHDANGIAIVQGGAIVSLIALLREGTTTQKEWVAYTLGNLASSKTTRDYIEAGDANMLLLKLLDVGTAIQKERAAYALTRLVCGSETIGSVGVIMSLVELVRMGSGSEKQYAARIVGKLGCENDEQRDEIGHRGAISPLVKLLQAGSDEEKEATAFALNCLANSNEANRFAILEEGALESLKYLAEFGTEGQKTEAAGALHHLDAVSKALLPDQFVAPLMEYFRAGVDSQSTNVATALNKLETVRDGFVPLFQRLAKSG